MTHELAGALQQPGRIRQLAAAEETDVDVSRERIDVTECRVIDAGGRLVIMDQLADVVSAPSHDVEPCARDRRELVGLLVHPGIDRRISPNRTRKLKNSHHAVPLRVTAVRFIVNSTSGFGSSLTPTTVRAGRWAPIMSM